MCSRDAPGQVRTGPDIVKLLELMVALHKDPESTAAGDLNMSTLRFSDTGVECTHAMPQIGVIMISADDESVRSAMERLRNEAFTEMYPLRDGNSPALFTQTYV